MAITVTATQGGSTLKGMALRVFVLTQAAAVQNGATANAQIPTSTAFTTSITTTQTGSRVYGAGAHANVTDSAAALTTLVDDVADAVNSEQYFTFKATSLTGTPGATTLGVTAASATAGPLALAEIKTAGTLTEDVSGPAVASTTAAIFVTTASFTPPPGSLLVALVASDGSTGITTMTLSDTSGLGLIWTELVKNNPSGGDYAGVWVAQVPVAGSAGQAQSLSLLRGLQTQGPQYAQVLSPPTPPQPGPAPQQSPLLLARRIP